MNTKRLFSFYTIALLVLALLSGCSREYKTEDIEVVSLTTEPVNNNIAVQEDLSVYGQDDEESVVYFYVTVQRGQKGTFTDHSFDEVENTVRFADNAHISDNDIYARAMVQTGDENGPKPGMLGYGIRTSNANIRIRGNSTSTAAQKSYKLELDSGTGLWRGQSSIAINKSIYESTRFRNKMYFDLLKGIDHVPSLRTQFVNLRLKDETAGEIEFKDYGLFTQVEIPNKKYLGNHGFDQNGYLYKAVSFEFEEEVPNFSDPDFDPAELAAFLKSKGKQDNQKLNELISMITDYSTNINDVVGPYIDRDNYITWLAFNILIANIDSTSQNYYIYSPLNSDKWYFIPWDGDGMLTYAEYRIDGQIANMGDWQMGIQNYWGNILHKRFLKDAGNRAELTAKIEELHQYINRETVTELALKYDKVVSPFVEQMPDVYYLGVTLRERNQIVSTIGDEVEAAYQRYYQDLDGIMPVEYLDVQEEDDGILKLVWEESFDMKEQNRQIQYELLVSTDPEMSNPLISETTNRVEYHTTRSTLPSGRYYWRVTAKTTDGTTASTMSKVDLNGERYVGIGELEVK